jgi:hypothetical protein
LLLAWVGFPWPWNERRAPTTDETDADNWRGIEVRGVVTAQKGVSRAHTFVVCRKSARINNIDQHPQTGEYHIGRPMQCSAEATKQRHLQHDYPTSPCIAKKGKLLIVSVGLISSRYRIPRSQSDISPFRRSGNLVLSILQHPHHQTKPSAIG